MTSRSFQRGLSWLPLLFTLAYTLITASLQVTACAPAYSEKPWGEAWGWMFTVISATGFGVLCILIFYAPHPNPRIGWLCGMITLTTPIISAPQTLLYCAEQELILLPGSEMIALLSNISIFVLAPQFIFLPLWFPDGDFISVGWRRFGLAIGGLILFFILLASLWPVEISSMVPLPEGPRRNLLGLSFQPTPELNQFILLSNLVIVLSSILIANISLFARWRRSSMLIRQQLKVFAYFLITISSGYMLFQLTGQFLLPEIDLFKLWDGWLYGILNMLLWAGYPLAVGVAVMKYHLYDIDLVIRRTLQYSLVTLLLALVYFSGVTLTQNIFTIISGQQSPAALVLSTLLIAALFNPLRRRVQGFIDRRFYRQKYDAEKALAAFAEAARSETQLGALAEKLSDTVQQTLQPVHLNLWLNKKREE